MPAVAGFSLFVMLFSCTAATLAADAKKAAKRADKQQPSRVEREEAETRKPQSMIVAPTAPDPKAPERRTEILELGAGGERFWVAFADKRISIWANRMPADKLLEELRAYGGPTFTCFEPLTRPVTLSLVWVRMEDVLRKMFDAYNFAYYYEDGRLAHVRILNHVPGRNYKVADPVVTRLDWTQDVLGAAQ